MGRRGESLRARGVEPPRSYPLEPESSASANFATPAWISTISLIDREVNSFNQDGTTTIRNSSWAFVTSCLRVLRRQADHKARVWFWHPSRGWPVRPRGYSLRDT